MRRSKIKEGREKVGVGGGVLWKQLSDVEVTKDAIAVVINRKQNFPRR